MGITSFSQEFASSIAPDRIFKALILDSNVWIPKLLPEFIKSVVVVQGDGGVGTIEQINFIEDGKVKFAKHRIEELDKEKLVCKYTLIEGDPLAHKLESIEHEVKFEAASSDDGGCICKMKTNYNAIGDFGISQDEIEASQVKALGIYKVVEAYLLENPHAYA